MAATAAQPHENPLDDWLGDISDDDWSENPPARTGRRFATPPNEDPVPEEDVRRNPTVDLPAGPVAAAEAHRAIVERRRLVAGLALVVVLALAVVIPLLLLRGGGQAPLAPVTDAASTTPTPGEPRPSSTSPTTSTTPSTTTPSATPSTDAASTFTLPEGTKLQRGEGDPAVIKELQQALSSAGYDPGPADGTFGRRTEAAVVAFQQDNDLSVDGVVGPETASALNSAVAGG